MSPDTKILLAYFIVMGVLVPTVVGTIRSTMKKWKQLQDEDSDS